MATKNRIDPGKTEPSLDKTADYHRVGIFLSAGESASEIVFLPNAGREEVFARTGRTKWGNSGTWPVERLSLFFIRFKLLFFILQ